jgi:hypothetical protein
MVQLLAGADGAATCNSSSQEMVMPATDRILQRTRVSGNDERLY